MVDKEMNMNISRKTFTKLLEYCSLLVIELVFLTFHITTHPFRGGRRF